MRSVIRQLVPALLIPLCLVASGLATAPWLRSFPASIAAAPLFGAAVLSVLAPLVVVRFRPQWLWASTLVDLVMFVIYTLSVVLQDFTDFSGLVQGLYRGPSEVLTFALPLVSPRSLMVAPVALTWIAGALAGECLARKWYTTLPYVGFLAAFGLSYAATQRAVGTDASSALLRETLLGAGLLATLLLMRVAQAWVRQDDAAESTQSDGILPLRGLAIGTVTAVVICVVASFVVQSDAFPKRANTPQRVPTINNSRPLSPLAFVAGLRPRTATSPIQPVFNVRVDGASPGYFALANVDFYDGSGWSFDRTFRPSGGVLPQDPDAALQVGRSVTQQYHIASGALTSAPWMPFMYRAQKVTGTSVNIDPASGMIVPAGHLGANATYTVRSAVTATRFAQLKTTATPDTATPTIDTELPGSLRPTLDRLVRSFSAETGVPTTPAVPFLQALQRDLQSRYALSSAAQGSSVGGASSSAAGPATPSASPSPTPTPKTTPKSTPRTSAKSSPHRAKSSHRARAADVHPLGAGNKSKHPRTHTTSRTSAHTTSHAPAPHPASSSATPSPSSPADDLAGSTGFADVLASIVGTNRSGTPEQFATLVALVARDLGVPARVATGFRVEPTGSATLLPAGSYDVTTAQAWTWTEIPIVGAGWVVLDGSPGRFTADQKATQSGAPPPPSSTAPPSQNALVTQDGNGHAVAPKSNVPASSSAPASALLIALLVLVGVLLIAVLVVLLSRKPVRAARRRRAPDPRARLIGAWQESMDVLTEAGLPELRAMTSAEIAVLAGEQFGGDAGAEAAALGSAANAVTYSAATVVVAQDADEAWRRERRLRQLVRRQLGPRDRMTAGLRYHRHRKRAERPVSPTSWAAGAALARESARDKRNRRRYRGRRRAH